MAKQSQQQTQKPAATVSVPSAEQLLAALVGSGTGAGKLVPIRELIAANAKATAADALASLRERGAPEGTLAKAEEFLSRLKAVPDGRTGGQAVNESAGAGSHESHAGAGES